MAHQDQRNTSSNAIGARIKVDNAGPNTYALSSLSLRYYFTLESAVPEPLVVEFWDWTHIEGSVQLGVQATGTIQTCGGGERYALIGFTGTSELKPGESLFVTAVIRGQNWTCCFDQSNDYSFNGSLTGYTDSPKTPAFSGTSIIWGVTP
jgi:hypothetical protein